MKPNVHPVLPLAQPAPFNRMLMSRCLDESRTRTGHVHHVRDFGIGYGNSSGYGSVLHFTDGHIDPLFRFR